MDALSEQITEHLRAFMASRTRPPGDFPELLMAAIGSNEFIALVLMAEHVGSLVDGDTLGAYILAEMIWVGMRIERARGEVAILDRMFRCESV